MLHVNNILNLIILHVNNILNLIILHINNILNLIILQVNNTLKLTILQGNNILNLIILQVNNILVAVFAGLSCDFGVSAGFTVKHQQALQSATWCCRNLTINVLSLSLLTVIKLNQGPSCEDKSQFSESDTSTLTTNRPLKTEGKTKDTLKLVTTCTSVWLQRK